MRRLATVAAVGVLAAVALSACGPPRKRVPTGSIKVDSLSGPHFGFARSQLTQDGRVKVQKIAIALNAYPNRRVQVNGFCDSEGDDERNQRLSERRAEAVRDALVEDGVTATRITTHGYGKSNPVASNATAEGRAQNRRVEIVLE